MMYQSFFNYEGFDSSRTLTKDNLSLQTSKPEVNKNYQQRGIISPNLSIGYKSKICYQILPLHPSKT